MQYRCLTHTDIYVSAIGLGGWALGGGYDWGTTSEEQAVRTVSAALDAGITLIDTAPIYGQSEALLGRILRGQRKQVVLSTKCGLLKNGSWTDHDLRPPTICRQLEQSLQQLQTDYIDIYFIHYLDPHVPWQTALETLARLQTQGKIRASGVCNIPPDVLAPMLQTGLVACVQDEFSYLHATRGRAVLEVCRAHGVSFMGYGSLCGGILSGKYHKEPNFRRADARNYFYKCYRGEAFTCAQQEVSWVQAKATQCGVTPAQWALAWALEESGITCVLTGARTAEQIRQNAQAAEVGGVR